MPLIQVNLIEEIFRSAQKKEMIAKLTDAMVAIEGENMRPCHLDGGSPHFVAQSFNNSESLQSEWDDGTDHIENHTLLRIPRNTPTPP